MTDPKRAAEIAAAYSAIRPIDWEAADKTAEVDRYVQELIDFGRDAERRQWHEENRGPYRPRFLPARSAHGREEHTPQSETFARDFAAKFRGLPLLLQREILEELAQDFVEAIKEEGGQVIWVA